MTTDILELIKKEKCSLEKYSSQLEELQQSGVSKDQQDLYDTLRENIKSKLQIIEDLEFEILEKQISFEESQQKASYSSSSSPKSQSLSSDIKSGSDMSEDKSSGPAATPNKMSSPNEVFREEVFLDKMIPLPIYLDKSPEAVCIIHEGVQNDKSNSFRKFDYDCSDTLTHSFDTSKRPASVSSFRYENGHLSNFHPNVNFNKNVSNFNRSHNQSSSVRSKSSVQKQVKSRPLTRYLPNPNDPRFNLKGYIEGCGHNLSLTDPLVKVDSHSCYGQLHKLSGKHLKMWKKKSFIFDRNRRLFAYYVSSTSTKLKGMITFDQIVDVHSVSVVNSKLSSIISNENQNVFCVTLIDTWNRGRHFKEELKLSAPTPEVKRLWMDVIFTGAEAYIATLNANRDDFSKQKWEI